MAKLSSDALDSVTTKLHAFAEGLDEDERTALNVILAAAGGDLDDVGADDEVGAFNFSAWPSGGTFDLGMTRINLNRNIIGRFCGDNSGGGPWELILSGGDDELRRRI